ncbi:hypothetical protein HIM_10005 [Hirsutella minnesotensis 3608]|uniref:Uncharacterized protein n=1 Tax=Hirsutella minnesotensis 3608 TaxID=1043627 RepID=A0A0F7ZXF2_9HYPO|nr:hypothetical protein HIM_10005 [Hirsutella minnesotensis 3608]
MAPSPTSGTDSLEYFNEHGIYYLEDETIGRIVKQIDDLGLATSLKSWDYLNDVILANAVSMTGEACKLISPNSSQQLRRILEPFLDQPNPRRCHTFGPEPGHVFCFWPQSNQSHRLVVSVWSTGTKLELYDGSHTGHLKTVPASNGLFEVPRQGTGHIIHMEAGGMYAFYALGISLKHSNLNSALMDVRFTFQRIAGFTIAYGMDLSSPLTSSDGNKGQQV